MVYLTENSMVSNLPYSISMLALYTQVNYDSDVGMTLTAIKVVTSQSKMGDDGALGLFLLSHFLRIIK